MLPHAGSAPGANTSQKSWKMDCACNQVAENRCMSGFDSQVKGAGRRHGMCGMGLVYTPAGPSRKDWLRRHFEMAAACCQQCHPQQSGSVLSAWGRAPVLGQHSWRTAATCLPRVPRNSAVTDPALPHRQVACRITDRCWSAYPAPFHLQYPARK